MCAMIAKFLMCAVSVMARLCITPWASLPSQSAAY
jgi:hypothetical protein